MTALALAYANLKDITEINPLNSSDASCVSEIRDVLKKYNMLDRFGLCLLHKHFDLLEGEMLVEHTDPDARTLNFQVINEGDIGPGTVYETQWRLSDDTTLMTCRSRCVTGPGGMPHRNRHVWVND